MVQSKCLERSAKKCLECNAEMDFDYKKKHNLKFHQDLLRQRKSIRYNVVGAPKNPKNTGDAELLLRTAELPENPETTLPDDRRSDLSVHRTFVCTSKIVVQRIYGMQQSVSSGSNIFTQALLKLTNYR